MELPSVWGRHDRAVIDPVVIEGRALVTSIMDAPDDWHSRLQNLGFKRLSKAWLRVGALTQAEYFYVSPSIDLVGLRPEQVIDYLPTEKPDLDVPPFSVQDELLELWQRKEAAILTALTLEHGVKYSRQDAWRVIEATVSGSLVPESETLVGLALTSLGTKGAVPDDAQDYSSRLGWVLGESEEPQSDPPAVLMKAGESISWFDEDGVLQHGRLAQKVLTSDSQGVVYTSSPRWAGRYPIVAPEYINRSQFYYPGSIPDWLESDLEDQPQVESVVGTAPLDSSVTITPEVHTALLELQFSGAFPVKNWQEVAAQASPAAVESLASLEAQLSQLSQRYYGSAPIEFKLLTFHDELKLSLFAVTPDGRRAGLSRIFSSQIIDDASQAFELDIGRLSENCDSTLREQATRIRQQAAMAGEAAGVKGGMLLPAQMEIGDRARLQELFLSQQGQMDTEAFFRIMAATGVRDMYERMGAYGVGQTQRYPSLSFRLDRESPETSATNISVELHTDRWLEVDDMLSRIEQGEVFSRGEGRKLSNYVVNVTSPPVGVMDGEQLPGVRVATYQGETLSMMVTPDAEQMQLSYKTMLERLHPFMDDSSKRRIERGIEISAGFPLRERFFNAMATAKELPSETIKEHAQQALATGTKGLFLQGDAEWQKRVLDMVVKMVHQSSSTQAILMFNRKRSIAFEEVGFTDESLSQSRHATLQAAVADTKLTRRISGTGITLDLIDIVDPELTALLAGEQGLAVKTKSEEGEGHQDIGVVQGLAMKDIRGMASETLTDYADKMSDLQKTKYLKKELIFPRTTLQEMKEKGVHLTIAASWDALWKGLPSKPLSPAPRHTNAFIDLMYIMREHLSPIIEKHMNPSERGTGQFFRFGNEIYNACIQAQEKIDRNIYTYRSRRIRGIGSDWAAFDPVNDYRWRNTLQKLTWDDLVKERKKPVAKTGSRVQRDDVVRVGEDHRKGVDAEGEDFIKTFMFSGIEYGNWTNQKERGKHLNLGYDSMMDFAKVLGLEPAALSLGGRLGLCIGSRGRGGIRPAMAHFERTNYAINLTRMQGDGSLAHEYFHAVAAHYGQLGSGAISDITDTLGYALINPGDVPVATGGNALRNEVRESFFNLMVSIMRKPQAGADIRDIEAYRERSDMFVTAIEEDGGKVGKYWSEPCEMFARTMESWIKEHLNEQGQRNDYLVSAGLPLGGVYPDRDHLDRINHFASAWIDSLEVELRAVNHPYLGDVQIPTLNSVLRSQQPLSQRDIEELASGELARLFGSFAPELKVTNGKDWAGLYSAATNVIYLNHEYADKGTFYHEAWHACEGVLLNEVERHNLSKLFAPGTEASQRVVDVMRDKGWPEHVVNAAVSSSEEMTAYAFQLWATHDLNVNGCSSQFRRGRGFIDGVTELSGLFELEDAVELFERFASGDMATRATAEDLSFSSSDNAFIYWAPPVDDEVKEKGFSPSL